MQSKVARTIRAASQVGHVEAPRGTQSRKRRKAHGASIAHSNVMFRADFPVGKPPANSQERNFVPGETLWTEPVRWLSLFVLHEDVAEIVGFYLACGLELRSNCLPQSAQKIWFLEYGAGAAAAWPALDRTIFTSPEAIWCVSLASCAHTS